MSTVIETERLILKDMALEDKQAYFDNITHDKEVLKYFVASYNETIDELNIEPMIERSKKDDRCLLSVYLKESGEFIGIILQVSGPSALFPSSEIGYAYGRKYWGNGYASEALIAFKDYLFEKGIHKLIVSHVVENEASKRVIEKAGFKYEGLHIDDLYYHDKYYNCCYYYLINPRG